MKRLLIALSIFAVTVAADAATAFSVGGTSVSTNVSYAVAPAVGIPRTDFILAKSDSSAAVLRIYKPRASVMITAAAGSTASNLLCQVGGNILEGDVVVLRDVSDGVYKRVLINATNATGVIITNELTAATAGFTVAAGDVIYPMSLQGSFIIGATTTSFGSGGMGAIHNGTAAMPALFEIYASGLATNHSLLISGRSE